MHLKKLMTTASILMTTVTPTKAAELYKCTACPSGTWSDGYSRSCTSCLTTGVASCSSYTGKATSCSGGYGYSSSNQTCSICSAGRYSTGGTNGCTSCDKGTYQSSSGKTSCTKCSAGTYASSTGSTSCTNCSAGTYSSAGASSCSSCLSTGVSACSPTTGKATSCKAAYGFNSSAGSCTQCSAGYYSAGGTASCSKCSAGTYSSAGASSCTKCSAGTYASSTGSTGCTNCPIGTYSSAGASSCSQCAQVGAASCSASTGKATSCKIGYRLTDGSCLECGNATVTNSALISILGGGTKTVKQSSKGGTSTSCSMNYSTALNSNTIRYTNTSNTSYSLGKGAYLFVLYGGGGGGGGAHYGNNWWGYRGGTGEISYFVQNFETTTTFTCRAGSGGSAGTSAWDYNSKNPAITYGGNGSNTTCTINGTTYTARGGGGGVYGLKDNKKGDYGKIYSSTASYGSCNTILDRGNCGGVGGYEKGLSNYHGAGGQTGIIVVLPLQ